MILPDARPGTDPRAGADCAAHTYGRSEPVGHKISGAGLRAVPAALRSSLVSMATAPRCDVFLADDHAWLILVGMLDPEPIRELQLALDELREVGFRRVVLDVRQVPFLTVSGRQAILRAIARSRAAGQELAIACDPAQSGRWPAASVPVDAGSFPALVSAPALVAVPGLAS